MPVSGFLHDSLSRGVLLILFPPFLLHLWSLNRDDDRSVHNATLFGNLLCFRYSSTTGCSHMVDSNVSLQCLYFIFHQIFEILRKLELKSMHWIFITVNLLCFYLWKIYCLCSMAVWYTLNYLKAVLAEFSILNGSTSSTHSFGVALMRSQRAAS